MKIVATPEALPTRIKTFAMERGVLYRVNGNCIALRVQPIKGSEFGDYRTCIVFDLITGETLVKIGADFDKMCIAESVEVISDPNFTLTLSNS